MASLNIFNSFILNNLGQNWQGFQGPPTGNAGTPLSVGGISGITLSGSIFTQQGQLASSTTSYLIYNSANNLPTTFNFLWIWCDQTYYVQLVTSATGVCLGPFPATFPFSLPGHQMLGAAVATQVSIPPSTTSIAEIFLGNDSGNIANYQLAVIL